jgi:transposase-like protein
METEDLKHQLAKFEKRRGAKYPSSLRDAVVALSVRNRSLGKSHRKTAEELGMSIQTLSYWRALARSSGGKLARVAVVEDASAAVSGLVVEYGPLRVSGHDLAAVAELIRRLV